MTNLYNQAMIEKSRKTAPQVYPTVVRNLSEKMNWSMIRDLKDPKITEMLHETFIEIMNLSLAPGQSYSSDHLADVWDQFKSTGNLKYRQKDDAKALALIQEMNKKMRRHFSPF